MNVTRRHVTIKGRVQGVGFRWSCKQAADRLGVSGWVRNRADGTVEAAIEGEEHLVDELVAWCRQGPPSAVVVEVDVQTEAAVGARRFDITN